MARAAIINGAHALFISQASQPCGPNTSEPSDSSCYYPTKTPKSSHLLQSPYIGFLHGGCRLAFLSRAKNSKTQSIAAALANQEINPAMAMILDAFASCIQNMLTEMVEEEVHMLLGVPTEINRMDVKLRDLKKFLADADRRNITDKSVQGWVKELKGAMYDATDILDLCQLKAMERGPSRDMGCFNSVLFCMRNPLHAHDIGIRLKDLNEKLDDIAKRSETFKFINLTSYEDRGRKIESSCLARRETTGQLDKMGLVSEEIEEDTRHLVELLTRKEKTIGGHNKVMIFAIVGVGGIGKTTLAQNIFNNEVIQQEFEKKIWLSVNQELNDLDLLRRAITGAGGAGGDHQAARNTKDALVRTLNEVLEGYKTLLVMDDVWDHQAWEHVLKTPLTNTLGQGSCVLVTTRHDMVARGMMAEEPYHHVNKLKPEDAWSLLKKQVVKDENDERAVDMLNDIGMGIVEKCDGLPLAVKVMGGLLCLKRTRRSDWEAVLNDSIRSVSEMPGQLNNAIYLSYQALHPSLKPCFLHFSLLPKSTIFHVDDIVGMWISEGFVHGGSRDLEELGREYYDELMQRNLIEPDIRYFDKTVCSMHDVVRSFAQYVARDEALAAQNSKMDITGKLNSQKFIRLSLETKGSESNQLEWMSLQTQISLRTLISVGPIKIKPGDSLVTFSSLRILYVQDTNFDELAQSLVQLKHLRYLSIENTNTSMLPKNIGKMKFLQYISLLHCQSLEKLPGSIGKLQHLRFLSLVGTHINNVPKGFNGLANLRKLYGFPAYMDGNWCSLEELGSLSNLTRLGIWRLRNISSSSFASKARLFEKVRLSFLALSCTSGSGYDGPLLKKDENMSNKGQHQIEEVFDGLCPPPCLESLHIIGYFGRRLPSWMMSTEGAPLRSLRILFMEDLPFCTELPDGLCQLPCLELLQVRKAPAIKRVGPEFIQPHDHKHPSALENLLGSAIRVEVVECSDLEGIGNLPKTQKVTIIRCPKLKILEGLPALQTLELADYDMETLPRYLQDVSPRHLLKIYCDVSLLTSMATGKSGPEWVKFSHIRQVKAYAHDDENNVENKWYVLYTRDPFSFKTNINRSAIARARRQRQQRLWLAYSKTCPIEEEWAVGRADADKRQPLCQRFGCNAYRHLVPWLHRVCLHCCEAGRIADSTDQWTEAAEYAAYIRIELTAQQFARPRRA